MMITSTPRMVLKHRDCHGISADAKTIQQNTVSITDPLQFIRDDTPAADTIDNQQSLNGYLYAPFSSVSPGLIFLARTQDLIWLCCMRQSRISIWSCLALPKAVFALTASRNLPLIPRYWLHTIHPLPVVYTLDATLSRFYFSKINAAVMRYCRIRGLIDPYKVAQIFCAAQLHAVFAQLCGIFQKF